MVLYSPKGMSQVWLRNDQVPAAPATESFDGQRNDRCGCQGRTQLSWWTIPSSHVDNLPQTRTHIKPYHRDILPVSTGVSPPMQVGINRQGPIAILPVWEITVLCHSRINDLMSVIKCKNDKHLITFYKVIFSNITGTCILSHLCYITRGQQCGTEMKCIGKPICLTKLIHKLLFCLKCRDTVQTSFWTTWDRYNMK